MSRWVHLIIFVAALGFAKSASFVKLVILAGLGLSGLWMMHTLAQDFNNIVQSGFGSGGGGDHGMGAKLYNDHEIKVYKRSILTIKKHPHIDWAAVFNHDPVGCARSFICQIAASKGDDDKVPLQDKILDLARAGSNDNTWDSKMLYEALEHGQSAKSPSDCLNIYKGCPYTKRMMVNLLGIARRR